MSNNKSQIKMFDPSSRRLDLIFCHKLILFEVSSRRLNPAFRALHPPTARSKSQLDIFIVHLTCGRYKFFTIL